MALKHTLSAFGLVVASSATFAAPIPLPPGEVLLSDNNAEELINAVGSPDDYQGPGYKGRSAFNIADYNRAAPGFYHGCN